MSKDHPRSFLNVMRPLLVTWYVWQRLWQPNFDNPIFRHYRKQSQKLPLMEYGMWATGITLLLIVIFVLITSPSNTLFLIMNVAFFGPVLLLALNGVIFGVFFTLTIINGLLAYRRLPSNELIQLTSLGPLDMSMIITSARLHQNNRLYNLNRFLRIIVGVGLLGCVIVTLIISFGILGSEPSVNLDVFIWQWGIPLFLISGLFIVIYIDHVQSIVFSALSSLLTVHLIQNSLQVRPVAVILFLILQLLPYLVVLLIVLFLRFIVSDHWENELVQISFIFSAVVQFYLVRESMIAACWRWLIAQYDFTPNDLTP